MPIGALTIRRLTDAEQVAGFRCRSADGSSDLEEFLRADALGYQQKHLSRVYLGYGGNILVGYFALCCCAIRLQAAREIDQTAAAAAGLGDGAGLGIPGVLLARLAVDDAHQGRGLGSELFAWAVRIARQYVAPMVGCGFMVIDAYSHRVGFYQAQGCQPIGRERRHGEIRIVPMYFDLFPPDLQLPLD
jgi:GNAT superfamily N-acetyltransferase